MTGAWGRILDKYGQRVAVVRDGAETLCRAFLQPALETREDWFQSLPTPLGTVRRDQWLYLGPPEVSLDGLGDGYVAWNNTQFEVRAAQPVCLGEDTIYWWALLAVCWRCGIRSRRTAPGRRRDSGTRRKKGE